MNFFKSNNVQPEKKPLSTMFVLIIISSILVVSILVYGVIKYFDYVNLKRVVCDENEKLKENIKIVHSNNELLKNKKSQISDYISNNYEDTSCIGEWSECDNDCGKVYSVKKPKQGDGEDCEFSDGQIGECIDEGDCSPVDCAGYWGECDENNQKVFNLTTPSKRGGVKCVAEDGAIDRTSCSGAEPNTSSSSSEDGSGGDDTTSWNIISSIISNLSNNQLLQLINKFFSSE